MFKIDAGFKLFNIKGMSESAKVSFRLILVFLAVFCLVLVIASQASVGLW